MKTKKTIIYILTIIYLLIYAFPVSAYVKTTKSPADGTDVIYVAGNPNFYPIEYYDESDKCYKGVMPEILKRISDATGIDFVYVAAGREDQRLRMASNGQIELISGLIKDNADLNGYGITGSSFVIYFENQGQIYDVCFGFTSIASGDFRNNFEKALINISDKETLQITLTHVMNHEKSNFPMWVQPAVFAAALLFAVIIVVLIIVLHIKLKTTNKGRYTDSATGIGNKDYFLHHFNHGISKISKSIYSVAYIGFDVARVNRYYSYDESENQLRFAANELRKMSNNNDIVARIAGGSFILAHICLENEIDFWITDVLIQLNRYCEKFGMDYRPYFHAGVYKLMISDNDGEKVIDNAHQGYLYALNNDLSYAVSDKELLNKEFEDRQLLRYAAEALKKGEFKMYIQFIINAEGCISGGEVLSRWQHPQKGLLMPSNYINIMENQGTVAELDFYMFEESCKQLEEWHKKGYQYCLSCNFNRVSISSVNFVSRIKETAVRYNFEYKKLVIEITENVMGVNKKDSFQNISDCKALGFRIALDDVGGGYTSFSDLREYPIDIIKIDRSILINAINEQGISLLKGIIALVHSLNMQVLCEGIETEQQFQMLKSLNCNYFQGFYFYMQVPVREAEKIIENEQAISAVRGGL
ncbi:MAG: EAL domain-containing protein [Eubacteriales bacterium]